MPDRKQVMSWLEGLAQQDWRMFHSDSEVQEIARNALALLKEQNQRIWELLCEQDKLKDMLKEHEPVAPVLVGRMWECGKCHAPVGIFMDDQRDQFCRTCGRSVKWDA